MTHFNINIKFFLSALCCFTGLVGFADVTYYASTYSTLKDKIIDANNYASSTGEIATIILNAGDLIEIDRPLPIINHTNGKIILTGAGVDDGIIGVSSPYWEYGMRKGLVAINSGNLEITNLIFDSFTPNTNDGNGVGVHSINAKSLKITGCTFNDCGEGIHVTYKDRDLDNTVEIKSNILTNNYSGIYVLFRRVIITGSGGDSYLFSNDYDGDLVEIEQNDIDDCHWGITTVTMEQDLLVDFEIRENTIDITSLDLNSIGLNMGNARKGHYVCELNEITHADNAILLTAHYGVIDDSNFGMNFSSAGSVNMNTIIDCKHSFWLAADNFEFNLTGLDVDGEIYVAGDYPSSLRENLIHKVDEWYTSGANFKPINLHEFGSPIPHGNQGIPSPVPVGAVLVGSSLEVSYAVSGLSSDNAPFMAEFFELDPDFSTIEFLGSQSVPIADDATYSFSVLAASIAEGNKIGITITSLGTDLSNKIGTSEVSSIEAEEVQIPCEDCEKFSPLPGERYWMSAWVNVDETDPVKTYSDVSLQLMAFGGETAIVTGTPTGEIIDGWQRIVVDFTMPELAEYFRVRLNAHPFLDTYFDDIRIHPFNGSMKSYVYDGETFWLTSELDDNNYATFYEYDEEGGLVRIKKETSRGIVTIQETRSNTLKKDDDETEE